MLLEQGASVAGRGLHVSTHSVSEKQAYKYICSIYIVCQQKLYMYLDGGLQLSSHQRFRILADVLPDGGAMFLERRRIQAFIVQQEDGGRAGISIL